MVRRAAAAVRRRSSGAALLQGRAVGTSSPMQSTLCARQHESACASSFLVAKTLAVKGAPSGIARATSSATDRILLVCTLILIVSRA
jgi:hypothetical protein